jgi:hypothetical protein
MARTKQKQPKKRTLKSLISKTNRVPYLENLEEAKGIISLLSSGKISFTKKLQLLGSLSMFLINTHSRITIPSIPIERFLNQLKIHLLIAQTKFLDVCRNHVQQINEMNFDTSTFDGMSRSVFELLQHCSMIESLITQIESSFGMIRMILEQIPPESRQRLVKSIQNFRNTFDKFVNDFSSKKEEILMFLNSAKKHIELMISHSETASSLESKIQDVSSSLSTASSHTMCMESVRSCLQTQHTKNETTIAYLIDSMKRLIEDYVQTQPEKQIEFPTVNDVKTQIDSILHVMSSISPQFELYHHSDSSPTARTHDQNLFDSRMKKGLNMIYTMIVNQNTQGVRKVCAYLDVLIKHCY